MIEATIKEIHPSRSINGNGHQDCTNGHVSCSVSRKDIDWMRIDWRLSDASIADQLRVNKSHVNTARRAMDKPQATFEKVLARERFRTYLLRDRNKSLERAIPELVEDSGVCISRSAAYRVAFFLGLRGRRQNKSRYDEFWSQLNWKLPDSDLSSIWGVERGNIQSKRKSLVLREVKGVNERAVWNRLQYDDDKDYQKAIETERRKIKAFKGLRPS